MFKMSNHQTHQLRALSVLIAVLGFSLSFEPKAQESQIYSRDLASNECSIAKQIRQGDATPRCVVTQVIDGETITGEIAVQVKEDVEVIAERDPNDPTVVLNKKEVKSKNLLITGDANTEGTIICDSGDCAKSIVTKPTQMLNTDAAGIEAIAKEQFRIAARQAAQLKKQQKEKQKRQDLCLEETDGTEITGKARIHCRILKLAQMTQEDAGRFWDENIKDDIHQLLKSCETPAAIPVGGLQPQATVSPQCAQDARDAAALLTHAKNNSQGNPYVQGSVQELSGYGTYLVNVKNLQAQIAASGGNPQAQSQYAQQLQRLKNSWGQYYQSRGLVTNQINDFMTGSGWSYTGTLANDLAEYQAQLDATYNSILNNAGVTGVSNNVVGNSNNFNNGTVGTGRLGRGGGGNPNMGAPVIPWNQPLRQQQMPNFNGVQRPGGARIPMNGTPVR